MSCWPRPPGTVDVQPGCEPLALMSAICSSTGGRNEEYASVGTSLTAGRLPMDVTVDWPSIDMTDSRNFFARSLFFAFTGIASVSPLYTVIWLEREESTGGSRAQP